MYFLPAKHKTLANVLKRLFPQRIASTIKGDGWLVFACPIVPYMWEPSEKYESPQERCECHPGYVCHACRARYERRRAYTPIPF